MSLLGNHWFHRVHAEAAPRLRLFCFPYGGAGHTVFLEWPRLLPDDVQVCMAKLPGRGPRFTEAAYDNVDAIVADLIEMIPALLDVPFVLFGHSVGALITFELARELARRGQRLPVCLIASGRAAPQVPYSGPLLHQIDEDSLKRELRRIGGTPDSFLLNDEVFRAFLPMLRADFAVTERYEYRLGPKLPCAIHAFGGTDDPLVPPDSLQLWAEQTTESFTIRQFQGDHFFINTCRNDVVAAVDNLLAHVCA